MEDSDMIIIAYFLLIHPGEYTESKSESTLFRLKDNAFSCICSVFASTDMASDLSFTKFVTLTFTTQKNGARKKKGHKASGDPIL